MRIAPIFFFFAFATTLAFAEEKLSGGPAYFEFATRKALGLQLPKEEAEKWVRNLPSYALLRYEFFEAEVRRLVKNGEDGKPAMSVKEAADVALQRAISSRPRTLSEAYIKKGLVDPIAERRAEELAKNLRSRDEAGYSESGFISEPWMGSVFVERYRQKDYLFGNRDWPVWIEADVYRGFGPYPSYYPYYYPYYHHHFHHR